MNTPSLHLDWPLLTSAGWPAPASRRTAARRAVVLPCQAVREHDFKLIADRTFDVSADGLLLPLRTRVLTGESLIVSFAIPGMWIDAEATVTRVLHGRRPGDDGLAVGVMFDRLAPGPRAALVGFLHGRREPQPRRERGSVPLFVVDCADENDVVEAPDEPPADDDVDGLDLLRAVVTAWKKLSHESVELG